MHDEIRIMHVEEVRPFVLMGQQADADSGTGHGHYSPYSKDTPFDLEEAVEKEKKRWTTPFTEPGWRRSFCWFVDGEMAGSLTLVGGNLLTELHRVSLGMGLLPEYRGRGGGTKLLNAALEWASFQSQIAWVDLGVFGDNPIAEALYRKIGFKEIGREKDRFRIDGVQIDNISMTYYVGDEEVGA